jgi:hypothetical protein
LSVAGDNRNDGRSGLLSQAGPSPSLGRDVPYSLLLPEELGRRRPRGVSRIRVRPIVLVLPNLFGTSNKTVDPQGKSVASL